MRTQESIRSEARFIARGWHRIHFPNASEEEASRYADAEWRRFVHLVGQKKLGAILQARQPVQPE